MQSNRMRRRLGGKSSERRILKRPSAAEWERNRAKLHLLRVYGQGGMRELDTACYTHCA